MGTRAAAGAERPEPPAGRHHPPQYGIDEPNQWAAKNVGGGLMAVAGILIAAITAITDLRHEPFVPTTRLINYVFSGVCVVGGVLLLRSRSRVPQWLINSIPAMAVVAVCIPTTLDKTPSALGPLLLTWPVTFAAAVLSARVAWITLGVAAVAFAVLASVSRGVDGVTFWLEVISSLTVICWMVVRVKGQSQRLREALGNLARTDPLTGLVNRRGFDEALEREHGRHQRGGASDFSLMVVDIDHFKQVNDAWGHQAGDTTLRQLAQLLAGRFRRTDVVGRIGGEEFAILAPDCTADRALTRAQELCDAVRQEADGWEHPITISIGVATVPDSASTPAELLSAADMALYAAKAAGRDQAARAARTNESDL